MLGPAQAKRLERLAAAGVRLACQVVQPAGLPAPGFGDPALAPHEHVVLAAELGHRPHHLHELMRAGQIPAEQRHDLLGIAVEHGEPLAGVADGERILGLARGHGLPVGGHPFLAERLLVADRVDLEQVLIGKPEGDHPLG